MKKNLDIDIERLEEKMKNVPYVAKRYIRIKIKSKFRKLTGINLK